MHDSTFLSSSFQANVVYAINNDDDDNNGATSHRCQSMSSHSSSIESLLPCEGAMTDQIGQSAAA